MSVVPIPAWNAQGVIPPIDAQRPNAIERSPYPVALTEFILRFSTSGVRCDILRGFLSYRTALHAVGLTQGFQWIDGSFLESIETIEGRQPKDVDVVTFYRLPPGRTQADVYAANPNLFPVDTASQERLKNSFKVDAYMVDLGSASESLVDRARYWYSMWSHRRDYTWKGYVQIDLASANDAQAQTLLQSQPHATVASSGSGGAAS